MSQDVHDRDLPEPSRRETHTGMILGIDLGERRIGVATGDRATGRVAPLTTLRRATPERDARSLRRLIDERHITDVVVGPAAAPRRTRGRAGAVDARMGRARRVRRWSGRSRSVTSGSRAWPQKHAWARRPAAAAVVRRPLTPGTPGALASTARRRPPSSRPSSTRRPRSPRDLRPQPSAGQPSAPRQPRSRRHRRGLGDPPERAARVPTRRRAQGHRLRRARRRRARGGRLAARTTDARVGRHRHLPGQPRHHPLPGRGRPAGAPSWRDRIGRPASAERARTSA